MAKNKQTGSVQDQLDGVKDEKIMDIDKKIDFLWNTMGRIDSVINSVNAKAGFLIAFNCFLIGSVSFKAFEFSFGDDLDKFRGIHGAHIAFSSILLVLSVISVYFLLKSVFPRVDSPKELDKYHSNIFFDHIRERQTEDNFHKAIGQMDNQCALKDLAFQIHVLSKIAKDKIECTGKSVTLSYWQIGVIILYFFGGFLGFFISFK
jgi:hypothetical protein